MPVVPLSELTTDAFQRRYGVPAINIVNDLTLEGVLAAAVESRSPLIVQTSVKTVRSIGSGVLKAMWDAMTADVEVPVTLHLDHCPERAVITECLERGWNSVLFDASHLPVEENLRQTIEVVAEARRSRRPRRGRDRVDHRRRGRRRLRRRGRTPVARRRPRLPRSHRRSTCSRRPSATRTGRTSRLRSSTSSASRDIVAARPIPIALHGGSGLSDEQFHDLIGRGCAKVNISTALKETYMKSNLASCRRPRPRTSGTRPRCSTPSGPTSSR